MRPLIIFSFLVFLFSCKEKDLPATVSVAPSDIIIVNEGNFNLGNASIALLDQMYQIKPNVFEQANGRKVGDVLQDLVKHQNSIYMVVNNSGKIEKLDAKTFVSEAYNDGFVSPRKICFFDSTRAYVSDLYRDALYEIDPKNLAIKKVIPCIGWTEDMLTWNEQVFVVNVARHHLLVYQPNLNVFVDSIALPKMPGNMLMDKNHHLWVYCTGETNQASKLIQLKTNPLQLVRTFDLDPLKEFYPRLAMNAAKDQLYVLNSGVYQLHIESAETGERLIKGNGKNFYGLGINQLNQDIIISEIIDFNSPALIHIYNLKGEAIKTNIKGGIITSQFVN